MVAPYGDGIIVKVLWVHVDIDTVPAPVDAS